MPTRLLHRLSQRSRSTSRTRWTNAFETTARPSTCCRIFPRANRPTKKPLPRSSISLPHPPTFKCSPLDPRTKTFDPVETRNTAHSSKPAAARSAQTSSHVTVLKSATKPVSTSSWLTANSSRFYPFVQAQRFLKRYLHEPAVRMSDCDIPLPIEDIIKGNYVVEGTKLPGVDDQSRTAPVPEFSILLVAGEKPKTDGDLRGVEELSRQGDHAINEVFLDELPPDLPFAGLVAAHRAVRENEPRNAAWGEVVHHVLYPRVVGIAHRRRTELPAGIVPQPLPSPIADVERRIGEDEIRLEVLVYVVVERVGIVGANVSINPANR